MYRQSHLLLLAASSFLAAPILAQEFCNPLNVKIADPHILQTERGKHRYYLAGTGYQRYVSDNLVHWQSAGVYTDYRGTWAAHDPWGAEIHEHNERFYYLFSAKGKTSWGRRQICIAVADSPDDAFQPHAYPLWEDDAEWIDPHLFVDGEDIWLVATNDSRARFDGKARLYAMRLTEDLRAVDGEKHFLIEPTQPWENAWQEGASLLRHGDLYYMTWSSHVFDSDRYSVGYATAESILGPWTKAPENPILAQEIVNPSDIGHSGPGHGSFVRSPDGSELFYAFHTRRNSPGSGHRQLNITRAEFVEVEDAPSQLRLPAGSSSKPQQWPSGAPLPRPAESDEFDGESLDLQRWSATWAYNPFNVQHANHKLVIHCRPGEIHREQGGGENVFLQPAPSGGWIAETRVRFSAEHNFEQAFLIVWQDSNNYLALKTGHIDGPTFEVASETNEEYRSLHTMPNTIGKQVVLQVQHDGRSTWRFHVRGMGTDWKAVGEPVVRTFCSPRIGIGAWNPGSPRALVSAEFEWFQIRRYEMIK